MKQKARPIPLHLQKEAGKEQEKLVKTGLLEKVKQIDEDCFVSLVVTTVEHDKAIKIALDSRKLHKNQTTHDEHGGVIEPIFSRNHARPKEKTNDLENRSRVRIWPDGVVKRNKPTMRIRNNWEKIPRILQIKKGFYGLANIPTIFQEKTDRTLEYSTPV